MQESSETRVAAMLRAACARIDAVDAEWLLAHALQKPRGWLYAHADDRVDAGARQRFEALVERRAAGEPVAYLTGTRGFWSLDLHVTADTLIPRPETERLVELALARLPTDKDCDVADLGTGSGAIALAIASERPRARVLAIDASAAALDVARRNAADLGIRTVDFRQGDWCSGLGDLTFDLVASNPPYLADDDAHRWQGDLRHEPEAALVSGHDGLDAIRTIVRNVIAHLRPGGWLLLEHGWEQGGAVRALLIGAGFDEVTTQQDLEGRDRVTLGRLIH
jgi:release factor glutamine methyltransferase